MSSMFKKKGGLAFKPKLPSARPRQPIAPSASTAKSAERQPSIEAASESVSNSLSAVKDSLNTSEAPSIDVQSLGAHHQSPSTRDNAKAADESHPQTDTLPQHISPPPSVNVPTTDDVSSSSQLPVDTTVDEALHISQSFPDSERSTRIPEPIIAPSTSSSKTVSNSPTNTSVEQANVSQVITALSPAVELESQIDPANDTPPVDVSKPKPAKRAPAKRKNSRKADEALTEGDEATESLPKRPRRKATKPRNAVAKAQSSMHQEEADDDADADAAIEGGPPSKRKPGRRRSPTPEDAETQMVDLQQLKMADLTKDLRIGKKFSRHDELRERERKARARTKSSKDGELGEDAAVSSASPKPDDADKAQSSGSNKPGESSASKSTAAAGPQFRIVDGQIVLDQSSLVMDRHARAAAAQGDMETIEENDFTRLITSQSFMTSSKLKGPNVWNDDETELFYRGLRMFGTDFEMISKFFPRKQRRHVKLKFNREERRNPKRIDAALIGEKTIKMDIDEYRAFTGTEFEPVETIEAEQRKIQESYEEEQQRVADEQAEIMRKKREALFADEENGGGKKKRGKKKGKQAIAYGLNGEPIPQGD
ncbi:hypothetical protein HIM_01687 [Hirsutella minnesotensis 3608]|nr:hypothetical protein HIM_01687 [Hirsutella minnesotensis 3608]